MRLRLLPALLALCAAATACSGGEDPVAKDTSPASSGAGSAATCDYTSDPAGAAKEASPPPATPTVSGQLAATISLNAGEVPMTLDADAAPCTVGSFVSLAEQGYFDDTQCHRLVTQGIFILQCGDPLATGTGGPGYTIPDEVTGMETYPAGTLAMARTDAPHSGGSQFFLVFDDTPLPPSYTVFGQLSADGLDVVRTIAEQGTATGGTEGPPKDEVVIEAVSTG